MKRLVLALAMLVASVSSFDAGAAPDMRSYVAGNFSLELDGQSAGFLKSVGVLGYTRLVDGKLQAAAVLMPVDLRFGFAVKRQLDWAAAFVDGKGAPQTVGVVGLDYKLDAKYRLEFGDFEITEVVMPACDGSSKEPAYIDVRGRAKKLARMKASGKAAGEYGKNEQKLWLPQNFRLTIDGVDATKVNYISPIKLKKTKSGVEIAPFDVSFAEISAETWFAWGEKTMLAGEHAPKTAKIEYLDPTRTQVLAKLELTGVVVAAMNYGDKAEANSDAIKRVRFTLVAGGATLTPLKPVYKKGG